MHDLSSIPLDQLDPAEAWARWEPSASDPWGRKWAGHLYRRAGFGASWAEVEAAVAAGPEAAVARLLEGGPGGEDFDRVMDSLAPGTGPSSPQDGPDGPLAAWWLHRMIRTPRPLLEKLCLFWHDHFATSVLKVRRPGLMARQNQLIREHALGRFGPFLRAMGRDPAMLIWLDSNSNVKGSPNENYARELLELFALGVGHYAESDVRDAARAFTGWRAEGESATFDPARHDDGPKTVLGHSGPLGADDVGRIVLEQPAAAPFLVRKFYRAFVSEAEAPPDRLIRPLAEHYAASGYDTSDLVGTLLRSRLFFSAHSFRQRVKGPVEYVVGLLRALEATPVEERQNSGLNRPPTLDRLMDGLGQTLFAPPNVKGWPGGESWLNSATLLARHNLAWKVVQGSGGPAGMKANPSALARKHGLGRDAEAQVGFLLGALLQPGEGELDGRRRGKLVAYLAASGSAGDDRLREVAHAVLLMPEYQLA